VGSTQFLQPETIIDVRERKPYENDNDNIQKKLKLYMTQRYYGQEMRRRKNFDHTLTQLIQLF